MSNEYKLQIPDEQAKETPMVDLAFMVLKAANTPFYYRDLMAEIAKFKGFSEDEAKQVIAQLYTEINVDGRFACVGNNLWGLKRWYPVDNKGDDAVGNAKRPRIINDEDDDLDEEDIFPEEEDEEDLDTFDAESEDDLDAEVEVEVEEEEEEEEFFPDEVLEEDGAEDDSQDEEPEEEEDNSSDEEAADYSDEDEEEEDK